MLTINEIGLETLMLKGRVTFGAALTSKVQRAPRATIKVPHFEKTAIRIPAQDNSRQLKFKQLQSQDNGRPPD